MDIDAAGFAGLSFQRRETGATLEVELGEGGVSDHLLSFHSLWLFVLIRAETYLLGEFDIVLITNQLLF